MAGSAIQDPLRARPHGVGQLIAWCAVLILSVACSRADADFMSALKAYEAQDFATAHTGFLELAELGDGASQFNLGAMALRGDGIPKDMGVAAGWLQAAKQNGYSPNPEILVRILKQLTAEQQDAANAIVARYGRAALLETVLPKHGSESCPGWEAASSDFIAEPNYPMDARRSSQDGVVVVAFTVGFDGMARDPQIVGSEPSEVFDAAAVNAILLSRFRPARYQGAPTERRHLLKLAFSISNDKGVLWDLPSFQRVRTSADAGHPRAQYLVGLAAWLDSSLGIAHDQARQMILSSAQGGEPRAQYWIATFGLTECEAAEKTQHWLEHSARGGEPAARLELARRILHGTAGPADLERAQQLLEGVADTRDGYVLKHAVAIAAGVSGAEFRSPALSRKLAKRLDDTVETLDPQREEALAAASALAGDFGKAEKLQSRALNKATQLHWNAALIEERLATYRSRQAWSGDLFLIPGATLPPSPPQASPTPEPR